MMLFDMSKYGFVYPGDRIIENGLIWEFTDSVSNSTMVDVLWSGELLWNGWAQIAV